MHRNGTTHSCMLTHVHSIIRVLRQMGRMAHPSSLDRAFRRGHVHLVHLTLEVFVCLRHKHCTHAQEQQGRRDTVHKLATCKPHAIIAASHPATGYRPVNCKPQKKEHAVVPPVPNLQRMQTAHARHTLGHPPPVASDRRRSSLSVAPPSRTSLPKPITRTRMLGCWDDEPIDGFGELVVQPAGATLAASSQNL